MTTPFEQIHAYILQFREDEFVHIEAGDPASDIAVAEIGEHFTFPLPSSFKNYLVRFGTLNIGGLEFGGSSTTGYLDVVRVRDDLVENFGFPNDLVPLLNEDGDSYVCIRSDNCLIRWYPGSSSVDELPEVLEEHLLRLCDELIEDEAEEA